MCSHSTYVRCLCVSMHTTHINLFLLLVFACYVIFLAKLSNIRESDSKINLLRCYTLYYVVYMI